MAEWISNFLVFVGTILGSGVVSLIGVGVACLLVMAFYWKAAEPLGFYAHHRLKSLLNSWDYGNGEKKTWTKEQLERRAIEAEMAKALTLKSFTTVFFLVSVAMMFCLCFAAYEMATAISALRNFQILLQ